MSAIRNSIAYLFKVHSSRQGLYLGASNISRQWTETLTYGALAVMIRAVAHIAKVKVQFLSRLDYSRIFEVQGGFELFSFTSSQHCFGIGHWNHSRFHDEQRFFMGSNPGSLSHSPKIGIVVYVPQDQNSHDHYGE